MATQYQMQACSSANGQLYSWLAAAPDWLAAGYVTAGYPGTAQDVTLTGGGLDTTGSADTSDVSVVAVTASGAYAVSASAAWAVTNRKVAVSASGATAVSASGAWAVTQ